MLLPVVSVSRHCGHPLFLKKTTFGWSMECQVYHQYVESELAVSARLQA